MPWRSNKERKRSRRREWEMEGAKGGTRDEGKVLHNLPVAPWKVNYRLRLPVWGRQKWLVKPVGSANKPRNPHPIWAADSTLAITTPLLPCTACTTCALGWSSRGEEKKEGVGKAGFDRKQALSGAAHLKANARGRAQFCTAWWSEQVKASGLARREVGVARVTRGRVYAVAGNEASHQLNCQKI